MRLSIFLLACGVSTVAATSSLAQENAREGARLVVLDTCVIASSTKDKAFTDFAKICQCAATKAVDEMSPKTHERISRSGELGFGDAGVWRKYLKTCSGE